jgi:hypothetical protein
MPYVNNFYGVKTQKNFYHGGSKMLSLIFHAGLFHESNFILCMVKFFLTLGPQILWDLLWNLPHILCLATIPTASYQIRVQRDDNSA